MTEKKTESSDRKYLIDRPEVLEAMENGTFSGSPHGKIIGVEYVSVERNRACLKIPYKDILVGNPETGVIHGGVIITLMDSATGRAVLCSIPEIEAIATLDLRVDYMKPAIIGKTIYASAECYKLTSSIAFVRGVAYQDDENDLVATCTATFMRGANQAPIKLGGA
ncbi:MAG: PaaI family thioesterase [Pseudomonadales bacterium]|nr:PaaI family thioesterase [Pseudomonadales bacterium]